MPISHIRDDSEAIVAASLSELSGLFAAGTVTPSDAAEVYLSRIEGFNSRLGAFLSLDVEAARSAARASTVRWAAGRPLSAIDGAPIGAKANIAVKGLPWHGGIAAYRDRIAEEDASCVAALRNAGAVVLGSLNMHEAALGATNDNAAFGRCHNPYRTGFTPGGSSGGSAAAVAARLCVAALGSDTMGSVRIPASYCGLVGHMAPRGSLSLDGVMPLAWTFDSLGPIARSADDAWIILTALKDDHSYALQTCSDMSGMVCGILDFAGQGEVDQEVATAFQRVLLAATQAGVTVMPIKLDFYDLVAVRRLCLLIVEVEALVIHEARLDRHPEGFSAELRAMLEWAAGQPAAKLAAAYRRLSMLGDQVRHAFSGFDAILTPTTGLPAFAFDQAPPVGQADFTLIANIAGFAATAFPAGASKAGLPLSAQIISANDATALTLARRFSAVLDPPASFQI